MKQRNTNKNQDSEKQKGAQRAIGGKKLYNTANTNKQVCKNKIKHIQ
jgi:hypothetical protein